MLRRFPAAAVSLLIIATACTTAESEPSTALGTTPIVTSTAQATTSTKAAVPVTSTTQPRAATTTEPRLPPKVTVELAEAPDGLAAAAAALYRFAGDPAHGYSEPPPAGLKAHLTGKTPSFAEMTLRGEAAWASFEDGSSVAVLAFDEDVVTAVDDGDGWRVVGADLERFGVEPWFGPAHRTILVIGSDARPGQAQLRFRADSLHIVTAVPARRTGALVGIPRDTWVDDPLGGQDKIAHLMASTGPEVELQGVRDFTGVPIEGYVVTGFKGFTELIDTLGGLLVDVPFRIVTNGFEGQPSIPAGTQRLAGIRALLFARMRKTVPGGDFTRSRHQGIIMLAALAEAQRRGLLAVPGLLETLLRHAWTDLDAEDLINVALSAFYIGVESAENVVLPGSTARASTGASIVNLDPEAWYILTDLHDGVIDES